MRRPARGLRLDQLGSELRQSLDLDEFAVKRNRVVVRSNQPAFVVDAFIAVLRRWLERGQNADSNLGCDVSIRLVARLGRQSLPRRGQQSVLVGAIRPAGIASSRMILPSTAVARLCGPPNGGVNDRAAASSPRAPASARPWRSSRERASHTRWRTGEARSASRPRLPDCRD
jgi:hypothetical protein